MGRSKVEAELADYSPSAVTVRVVQAALGAIPNTQPIPWYGTLEQSAELVFGGIPSHVTDRATAVLDELRIDAALAVARAVDEVPERTSVLGAVKSAFNMLTSAEPSAAAQQRADAAVKAYALAYLFTELLPGATPAHRLESLDEVPAALQLLQYFAAVDVAVPFADDVRNADGTFVAALVGAESGALTSRLIDLLGREGLDSAKEMLDDLLPTLDETVMEVLHHTPSLTSQVRGILPGSYGGTGTTAVAGDADALPAYRWLGARLALESGLVAARQELAPTHVGAERVTAPDHTASFPNPFAAKAPAAPPAPEPEPEPAPPPLPAESAPVDQSEEPASEEAPSPFTPTFEPAPPRMAAPEPEIAGDLPPVPEPTVEEFDLLAEDPPEAPDASPASELGPSPFEPVDALDPTPSEPTEPWEPLPAHPAAGAEATNPFEPVSTDPFDDVDAARDALEQMAPAETLTNGVGAMMLADAVLDPADPLEAANPFEPATDVDDLAETAVELMTVLTQGTTEWPTEAPPEHAVNPFLPDPDAAAGVPENPYRAHAEEPQPTFAPVDPFHIESPPSAASGEEAAIVVEPEPAPATPLGQPHNPFSLEEPENVAIANPTLAPAPERDAEAEPEPEPATEPDLPAPASPPEVPVGVVTASVAPSYVPSGVDEPVPVGAESPTLIPMPNDAAKREVAAAAGAPADAPPAPPPTVTPTWPTAELPEDERLRGAYLSTDGKWRIFSKEGIVTTAPPVTVAPVDWDAHWESGHTIALYKRRGNHATIEYFDAVPESFTVEREPYSLKINGQTWRRADYDLSDRTMQGQWSGDDGSDLVFDHEGQMSLDGRQGRYRLGAGRVDVTWEGGEAWVASFLSTLAPSSRHPQMLWLAGVQYTLRA